MVRRLLLLLALPALLPGAAHAATPTVDAIAGKPRSSGPPLGLGQAPAGTAVRDGKLYIADQSNRVVWVMNADGTGDESVFAGDFRLCSGSCGDGGPVSASRLGYPTSLAFDHQGNLFIGEAFDRIREVRARSDGKIGPGSTIRTILGDGGSSLGSGDGGPASAAHLRGANGMVVTAEGSLVIATGDRRVRIITAVSGGDPAAVDPGDTITTLAGTGAGCTGGITACGYGGAAGAAKLTSATRLAIDGVNTLFISDAGMNTVLAVNAGGDGFLQETDTLTRVAGDGTSCADSTTACGDGGNALDAKLGGGPVVRDFGLAVREGGSGRTLVIADGGVRRLRELAYVVTTTTLTPGTITSTVGGGAGCEAPSGCTDGIGSAARFGAPVGLSQDDAGRLYVTDGLTFQVRRVSALGQTSTLAGDGNVTNVCGTGACGNGGPAALAKLDGAGTALVRPDGGMVLPDEDGRILRQIDPAGTITALGGNPDQACTTGPCGDGGPLSGATLATVAPSRAADGTVFTAAATRVRAIKPDGAGAIGPGSRIETVAGSDTACAALPCADGAARSAQFGAVLATAVSPRTGEVAILDSGFLIRMLSADRATVATVAGGAPCSPALLPCGDGGPAGDAKLAAPGIAFAPDGDLYLADLGGFSVRRIAADADGRITRASTISTVLPYVDAPACTGGCGDGGPASAARVEGLGAIAVDPGGSVLIADRQRIRRLVAHDGVTDGASRVEAVAGTGGNCGEGADAQGYLSCGEGGPASAATFSAIGGLAVADDYGILVGQETRLTRVAPPAGAKAALAVPAATAGVPVTLALGATPGDNEPTDWTLEYGDGTSEKGAGAPPATRAHTYAAAGSRTARLMVSDGRAPAGIATATVGVGAAPVVPPPPPVRDTTSPVLSALKVSPATFRPAKAVTGLTGVAALAKRPKGGAATFTLSEPAVVALALTRGGTKVATLTRAARAGANSVALTGRLAQGRLAAGTYVVTAVARDAAGNASKALTARFTVAGIDAKASIRKRTKATALSAKGVLVAVSCGDACRIAVTLKVGRTTVGKGKAGAKRGTQLVRVTFTKRGLEAFRKAKRPTVTASVTVTDDVGTPRRLTATRRLR